MFKAWKIRVHHMYVGYKGRFVLGFFSFLCLDHSVIYYHWVVSALHCRTTVAGVVQWWGIHQRSMKDCTLTKGLSLWSLRALFSRLSKHRFIVSVIAFLIPQTPTVSTPFIDNVFLNPSPSVYLAVILDNHPVPPSSVPLVLFDRSIKNWFMIDITVWVVGYHNVVTYNKIN